MTPKLPHEAMQKGSIDVAVWHNLEVAARLA